MNRKFLGFSIVFIAVVMLATPVMAIGPQNSESNPNVFFPVYGVGLDAPSGIHHEWVNAAPVPIHLMWMNARDFKRNNAIVVTSTSEAALIENKWMYFSMELWATWLYEKIPMLGYEFWLAWAMANTPEGVYFHQVFVGQ